MAFLLNYHAQGASGKN